MTDRDRQLDRLVLELAAVRGVVDLLARIGPSKRFPEAHHRAAQQRAGWMLDGARKRLLARMAAVARDRARDRA